MRIMNLSGLRSITLMMLKKPQKLWKAGKEDSMTIFQILTSALSSFILTALFTPLFINYAHKKKSGTDDQRRRSEVASKKIRNTDDGRIRIQYCDSDYGIMGAALL